MANLRLIVYYNFGGKISMDENLKVEVRKGVLIYKAAPGQIKDIDEEVKRLKEEHDEKQQDTTNTGSEGL